MIHLWDDEDEFYDDLDEAWSWYSPTSSYRFIQDPTYENAAKAAWVPTLSLGTFVGFNAAMGGYGGVPLRHSLAYWSANVWQSRISTLRWATAASSTGVRYGAHLGRGALMAGYRAIPIVAAGFALFSAGNWLEDLHEDFFGVQIGDLSGWVPGMQMGSGGQQ